MPLIIPTVSLEKLKKFPSQVFIAVLLILLGYFINGGNRTKEEELKDTKERLLKAERQRDSMYKVNSDFKDALIEKEMELSAYKTGVKKIDSAASTTRYPVKQLIKRK